MDGPAGVPNWCACDPHLPPSAGLHLAKNGVVYSKSMGLSARPADCTRTSLQPYRLQYLNPNARRSPNKKCHSAIWLTSCQEAVGIPSLPNTAWTIGLRNSGTVCRHASILCFPGSYEFTEATVAIGCDADGIESMRDLFSR